MREREIEFYFVQRCAEHPCWQAKFISPTMQGVPDRVVCIEGVVFWIEFKAPGGKLSPQQVRTIARMKNSGCCVWLIDSFEAVDALFKGLEKC